jgi:hypothetical protein
MKKGLIIFSLFAALSQLPLLMPEEPVEERDARGAARLDASLLMQISTHMDRKEKLRTTLGYSAGGRAIELYYFPGKSKERALVIGGMHGSELSSIEVAEELVRQLREGRELFYDVLVIPALFPDNAALARSHSGPVNLGRYSNPFTPDPNRQMPMPGKPFTLHNPVDALGRTIERENQYLLQLIQELEPSRIANIHAIRDVTKAGIFADPRTNCEGKALGFYTDSALALSMARRIANQKGEVPGNSLNTRATAIYASDPTVVPPGFLQPRNLHGSFLASHRGSGISLGGWATSAVCTEKGMEERGAAKLITLEFPGYLTAQARPEKERPQTKKNVMLYAAAISEVFLSERGADQVLNR